MSQHHKILMITANSFPPTNPEAIVNAKLALAMLKTGWHVDIVTRDNSKTCTYPYAADSIWTPIADRCHFAKCIRKPHERMKDSRLNSSVYTSLRIGSNLSWITSAYLTAKSLTKNTNYDFILSRSGPISGHIAALMLARKTGLRWIANWNDPEPWSMFPPPYAQGPDAKLSFSWHKALEAIVTGASWLTFPCERLRQYMCRYLPGEGIKKSSVVPHIALQLWGNGQIHDNGHFTLCHAGRLEKARRPEVFLCGIARFLKKVDEQDHVRVRFIGSLQNEILRVSHNLGLDNVFEYVNPQTYQDTQHILKDSTVLAIVEAPMEEGIFLPSKLCDYIQTGRPILSVSPPVGALDDIISQHGGGLCVDNRQPESIADGIYSLYTAWKKGNLNQHYTSHHLMNIYGDDAVLATYERLFEKLERTN